MTLMDADTGEIIKLGDADLTITETNVTITTKKLKENRRYNTTIKAANVVNSTISVTTISKKFFDLLTIILEVAIIIAGTHDIENVTVIEENNRVTAKTEYFEHSTARGALYVIMSQDATGLVCMTQDKNTPNSTIPFILSGGSMTLFVYDIESNGTLANGVGYPAVNGEIVTSGTTEGVIYSKLELLYLLDESLRSTFSTLKIPP